jgi:hypothetical protein
MKERKQKLIIWSFIIFIIIVLIFLYFIAILPKTNISKDIDMFCKDRSKETNLTKGIFRRYDFFECIEVNSKTVEFDLWGGFSYSFCAEVVDNIGKLHVIHGYNQPENLFTKRVYTYVGIDEFKECNL